MYYLRVNLLLLLLLPGFFLHGDPQDSLKAVLSKQGQDTLRVNTLLEYSSVLQGVDPEEAVKAAEEARSLSEKLDYLPGLALSLKKIGLVYKTQGKNKEAVLTFQESLKIYDSIGDNDGVSNMYNNLGVIYINQRDDATATDYFLKSLKVAEANNIKIRIATALLNLGVVSSFNKQRPEKQADAVRYYLQALPLFEELEYQEAIGNVTVNLGEIYLEQHKLDSALFYFEKSLKAVEGSESVAYTLNDLGKVYQAKGDYPKALEYHNKALIFARQIEASQDIAISFLGLADTYKAKGDLQLALKNYKNAAEHSESSNNKEEQKLAYQGLSQTYSLLKDFKSAFHYQQLFTGIKDSLYNIDYDQKIAGLLFNFEIEKKQGQIDLLTKDKALQELDLQRQKFAKNAFMGGLGLIFIIAVILFRNYRIKVKTNKILDRQKDEIEHLLLNILPAEVAQELQRDGHATPMYYESVTVLFTDFKGFSTIAEKLSPRDLVTELNEYFSAFDDIIEKYDLEKIKTIGDAYMCAGGIPTANEVHPVNMILAALEIQTFMQEKNAKRLALGTAPWDLRIGVHTGPVVAGVVGRKKYAYDIWGNAVNIASRMESNGEPGKVNISASTYNLVKDRFQCIYRGKIEAKNIGVIDMFFVEKEIKPVRLQDQSSRDSMKVVVA
jgi:adenylate cyclase